jgi:tetratricopeptide (TPR) repeat protein
MVLSRLPFGMVVFSRLPRGTRGGADIDQAFRDYGVTPVINYAQNNFERAIANVNRGNARYAKGDFDRAIADYDEAIELNPSYAKAYYSRGLAYAEAKDYAKALSDFRVTHKLSPTSETGILALQKIGVLEAKLEVEERPLVPWAEPWTEEKPEIGYDDFVRSVLEREQFSQPATDVNPPWRGRQTRPPGK